MGTRRLRAGVIFVRRGKNKAKGFVCDLGVPGRFRPPPEVANYKSAATIPAIFSTFLPFMINF